MDLNSLNTVTFYGEKTVSEFVSKRNSITSKKPLLIKESRRMPSHILGPTQFYRHFKTQAEALQVSKERSTSSDTLCTFVLQQEEGHRTFIVAHPEVYWWYASNKPPEQQCSYEVIPEGEPCRLYFDLEFCTLLNPANDGPRMTRTFINIVCRFLFKQWGFPCGLNDVLNLDSTTEVKFSRHLIFCIKDIVFKNNFEVGKFVKRLCSDVIYYLHSIITTHDILSLFERKDLEELLVITKKDKRLFIDTGVYTRNRHFRVYKSTKWGKQAHLEISSDCKYVPVHTDKEKELGYFLDSLISYHPNKKNLTLLEFSDNNEISQGTDISLYNKITEQNNKTIEYCEHSPYPELDAIILKMIKPGKIRAVKIFENLLTYEICGNRYCENIGRSHKSNNIYWVVDLNKKEMYQKCHDEDCMGFRSTSKILPIEVCFKLKDENDDLLAHVFDAEEIDIFTDE